MASPGPRIGEQCTVAGGNGRDAPGNGGFGQSTRRHRAATAASWVGSMNLEGIRSQTVLGATAPGDHAQRPTAALHVGVRRRSSPARWPC